ncbi:MAG: formimidoylglutamase [Flavobacteriales bacterium]|nr:formimidoylglutamase [Flavobacteriales bacterium]
MKPYKADPEKWKPSSIGHLTCFSFDEVPDISETDIAIIGVNDGRNSAGNEGCKSAPDPIRNELYKMIRQNPRLRISDFGNIEPGDTFEDSLAALRIVTESLLKENVTVIILGGSKELTYGQYTAYEKICKNLELVNVSAGFDLKNDNYLRSICTHKPNYLFNVNVLGYQTYLVEEDSLGMIKKLYFEANRLGPLKKDITDSEPMIRNADMICIDMAALKLSDAPGHADGNPSGFSGEEACQLAWYAGVADKVKTFGIYELNPDFDNFNQSSKLAAQMIWYFIDGYYNRKNDHPVMHQEFIKYRCALEEGQPDAVFFKSKLSDRWWMEIPYPDNYGEHSVLIPCSYSDYMTATNGEMPDRFWRGFQKINM